MGASYGVGSATLLGYVRNAFDIFYLAYLFTETFGAAGDPREIGIEMSFQSRAAAMKSGMTPRRSQISQAHLPHALQETGIALNCRSRRVNSMLVLRRWSGTTG